MREESEVATVSPVTPVRPPGRCLVSLRATGSRHPLFFVHGLYGQVFQFYTLAPYLGADQPCYALEAPGLWNDAPTADTFQELARRYIDEMREVQPEGPYVILGFSAGGHVAWEMAQQLRQQGQEAAVGLLDTMAPGGHWPRYGRLQRLMRPLAGAVFPFRVMAGLRGKRRRAMLRNSFRMRVFKTAMLVRLPLDNRITRASLRAGRRPPPGGVEVVQLFLRAYQDYQLQPYDGSVALFRAELQEPGRSYHPDLGWGTHVRGQLDVIPVPGHHGFIFVEPHGATLADEIMAWEDRCLAASGQPAIEAETAVDPAVQVQPGHPG
ncbi:MAG: alpha/beta fold hydrolase [Dehalococcoidia bacterium]|nr:alpha/beta fold hydrolase [Dehalococcoidia bacterium]